MRHFHEQLRRLDAEVNPFFHQFLEPLVGCDLLSDLRHAIGSCIVLFMLRA